MKYLLVSLLGLLLTTLVNAQVLSVKFAVNKKNFMSNEQAYGAVTITNRGAQNLLLEDNGNNSWLTLNATRNGRKLRMVGKFGSMAIGPNETKVRKVTLNGVIPLTSQGNYTVRAMLDYRGSTSSSNPAFFNVVGGTAIYQQKVGLADRMGSVIEYRVKVLNTVSGSALYFENYDPRLKRIIATYRMGPYLSLSKPQIRLDGQGKFHILFQIGAKHFQYLKINEKAKVVMKQTYKKGTRGAPILIAANNAVAVRNAIEYDIEDEMKKRRAVHNISQRPPFSY